MGTIYYGVCHDCKQYIDLDKFGSLETLPIPGDDYSDYKTDNWLFKALRLHAFIHIHSGHKIGVYSETDFDFLTEDGDNPFEEQATWPVKEFLDKNKIEKLNQRISELERKLTDKKNELKIDEDLLIERDRLLYAIPECPVHGHECVPHAIEWVNRVKTLGEIMKALT